MEVGASRWINGVKNDMKITSDVNGRKVRDRVLWKDRIKMADSV